MTYFWALRGSFTNVMRWDFRKMGVVKFVRGFIFVKVTVINLESHGSLLFTNWLNYYVYQITPYQLDATNIKAGLTYEK